MCLRMVAWQKFVHHNSRVSNQTGLPVTNMLYLHSGEQGEILVEKLMNYDQNVALMARW